ncbi:MAG: hypothetical protein OEQ28_02180, partial [Acidobacteriota bacterium]|nr:hypothetical protein [Acidobacteriota bacterium]
RQAETLIMNSEGRLCARFYRRADGTIITKDCPVGWAVVRKRMSRVWTAVASVVLTAFAGIGIVSLTRETKPETVMGLIPITRIPLERIPVEREPLMGAVEPGFEMGDVAMPEDYTMGKVAVQ